MTHFVNNVAVGGKVWLFWEEGLDFEFVSCSDQVLTGWFVRGEMHTLVTVIYATCFQMHRRELWDYLCGIEPGLQPWLVAGDFNIIRSDNEKVGGGVSCSSRKGRF